VEALKRNRAPQYEIQAAERTLAQLPATPAQAMGQWRAERDDLLARAPLGGMPEHATQFDGNPDGTPAEQARYDVSRRNFLALVFCLMVGTAGLPHILMRFYTTPSVRRRANRWAGRCSSSCCST
jgi:cation/acetate symporter